MLFSGISYAQIDSTKLDIESFLIGTLDDYMGHKQTFSYTSGDKGSYQMVDIYYKGEKDIALLIDSLFKQKYTDLSVEDNGARLYSASMSELVNSYFSYESMQMYSVFHDTIYTGRLDKNKFVTEKQKLSFIAGAFLRNGQRTNTKECFLSMPNSLSKAKICEEFLKDLGCEDVSYEIWKNNIPAGHLIFFKPSDKVQNLIDNLDKIKKKVPVDPFIVKQLRLPKDKE